MKSCDCKEWIEKIQRIYNINEAMGASSNNKKYEDFIYCSYCGKVLKKEND